jgi:arylsulfatase A-like enzyme
MQAPARSAGPAIAVAALLLAALAAFLFLRREPGAVGASSGATLETPVVIYLIDTLRADRLGAYGYDKPTSPRLDRLARESVLFEQVYAPAPWTLPSVTSILTSRWPCEHGVTRRGLALNPGLRTLAERLQDLGYATGSFYQNDFAGPAAGLTRGFQVAEYRDPRTPNLAADTRAFLERAGTQPWFLYLHTVEPHGAHLTPDRFIRRFGHVSVEHRAWYRDRWLAYRQLLALPPARAGAPPPPDNTAAIEQTMAQLAAMRATISRLYDAAVRAADDSLGQVVDALRDRGLWDRTLFIVMSDHGEEFAEHGGWFHDQSVYEELVRVPLLVRFPAGRHGGRRVAARISLLDVMPTVLEVLHHPEGCAGCRGTSLVPLLEGAPAVADPAVASIRINESSRYRGFEERRGNLNVVMRESAWKGIWNADPRTLELYDLAADPGETRNLAATEPARSEQMIGHASQWLAGCRAALQAPGLVDEASMDDDTRIRLRAMGYFN